MQKIEDHGYLTFESYWWVFAPEFALITHYHPEWDESGFGSNRTRQRDQTADRVRE